LLFVTIPWGVIFDVAISPHVYGVTVFLFYLHSFKFCLNVDKAGFSLFGCAPVTKSCKLHFVIPHLSNLDCWHNYMFLTPVDVLTFAIVSCIESHTSSKGSTYLHLTSGLTCYCHSTRVKFMLELLLAIKNNNMRKIPNYDPSHCEHLKKVMKGFLHKGNYVTELRISLDDLLKGNFICFLFC
jgi:hypothetical protein